MASLRCCERFVQASPIEVSDGAGSPVASMPKGLFGIRTWTHAAHDVVAALALLSSTIRLSANGGHGRSKAHISGAAISRRHQRRSGISFLPCLHQHAQ